MSTLLRDTTYPHTRDSEGKPLAAPCDGHLQVLRHEEGHVYVGCSGCGEAYRFEFVFTNHKKERL